jgi:5-methylcytosine-specific restriction endonuclease McrA
LKEGIDYSVRCECTNRVKVVRYFKNGTQHFGEQCTICGGFRHLKKSECNPNELIQYDESIAEKYSKACVEFYRNKRQQGDTEWRKKYDEYMESVDWKRRRAIILNRDGHTCQGCLQRPAVHVHHLTYARLGNELAFDLISICIECHDKVHGRQEVNLSSLNLPVTEEIPF